MAIIYSYPHAVPTVNDMVLGAKFRENEGISTNSFYISDIVTLVQEQVGTIPTLQQVTEQGANTTDQIQINGIDVATINDIPTPVYKVYTALLTQGGGNNEQIINSGALTKGVTYYIEGNGGDFSNVGSLTSELGTYFVATASIEPSNWNGVDLGYNTGAPVATVLENTIGDIWFVYNETGQYNIVSDGLFSLNKTTGNSEIFFNGDSDAMCGMYISDFTINDATIYSSTLAGPGTLMNDLFGIVLLEIRVYN